MADGLRVKLIDGRDYVIISRYNYFQIIPLKAYLDNIVLQ